MFFISKGIDHTFTQITNRQMTQTNITQGHFGQGHSERISFT